MSKVSETTVDVGGLGGESWSLVGEGSGVTGGTVVGDGWGSDRWGGVGADGRDDSSSGGVGEGGEENYELKNKNEI